jgi:hypothetical protein
MRITSPKQLATRHRESADEWAVGHQDLKHCQLRAAIEVLVPYSSTSAL